MKMIIFSVHDSKAEAFIQPFFAPTVAVGIRQFSQAANDQNTDFARFAGDYTLFQIGTFDQQSGAIRYDEVMKNHGLAITFINPEQLPVTQIKEVK